MESRALSEYGQSAVITNHGERNITQKAVCKPRSVGRCEYQFPRNVKLYPPPCVAARPWGVNFMFKLLFNPMRVHPPTPTLVVSRGRLWTIVPAPMLKRKCESHRSGDELCCLLSRKTGKMKKISLWEACTQGILPDV